MRRPAVSSIAETSKASKVRLPKCQPFQLAFILLTLRSFVSVLLNPAGCILITGHLHPFRQKRNISPNAIRKRIQYPLNVVIGPAQIDSLRARQLHQEPALPDAGR